MNESLDDLLSEVDDQSICNPCLMDPTRALQLFGRLLSREEEHEGDGILGELRSLFDKDFKELVSADLIPGDGGLILEFERTLEQLTEALIFPALETKHIFAVGGGFSTGKSSFINALIDPERELLPTDTLPTTSIPALICYDVTPFTGAINLFDKRVSLEVEELQAISHEFHERHQVGFSGLLDYVVISHPDFPFSHAALLDTPGYSKPDGQWPDEQAGRTSDESDSKDLRDRALAQRQLESADFVLWLVDVGRGTLPKEDIDFISTLRNHPELFVVVTKADQKPAEEVAAVVKTIEAQLTDNNIGFEGIIPFSAHEPNLYPLDPLRSFINDRSAGPKSSKIHDQFVAIFSQYHKLHEEYLAQGSDILKVFNDYQLKVESPDAVVKQLARERRDRIKRVKELSKRLSEIENTVMTLVDKARAVIEEHRIKAIKRMSSQELQTAYASHVASGHSDADRLLVDGAVSGSEELMKQLILRLMFPEVLPPLSQRERDYLARRLDSSTDHELSAPIVGKLKDLIGV